MRPKKTSEETKMSRRVFLHRGALTLGALAVVPTLAACGGGEPEGLNCENPPGITPAERTQRTNVGYIERATDATRKCSGCSFYVAAAPGQCGGCNLNIGPVNPDGSCNSFVART